MWFRKNKQQVQNTEVPVTKVCNLDVLNPDTQLIETKRITKQDSENFRLTVTYLHEQIETTRSRIRTLKRQEDEQIEKVKPSSYLRVPYPYKEIHAYFGMKIAEQHNLQRTLRRKLYEEFLKVPVYA